MKNVFKATVLIALMCGVALAQNASPSSNSGTPQPQAQTSAPQTSQSAMPAQHPTRIAPGSVNPQKLTKTQDAKKAKTGDELVAKAPMDMKTQSGDVLVPNDTKVIGHVTEAQKREKDQKQSELGLAFDHAVTKDGNTMQMPMSIQAVIGQQQNQESEANTPAGREEAAGVPSGAAPTGAAGGKPSGTTPPAPSPSASGSGAGADTGDNQAANGGRPPITAQTQGVIGISNLTLAPASNVTQGTVMTSDKNNVKLESGTMLLLKVNQ